MFEKQSTELHYGLEIEWMLCAECFQKYLEYLWVGMGSRCRLEYLNVQVYRVQLTVGLLIIEFRYYRIAAIWIFSSQLTDSMRSTSTRDDIYYPQKLNRSIKISFGPRTSDRQEY